MSVSSDPEIVTVPCTFLPFRPMKVPVLCMSSMADAMGEEDGIGVDDDMVSAEVGDAAGVELQPARDSPRASTATPSEAGMSAVLRMIAPFVGAPAMQVPAVENGSDARQGVRPAGEFFRGCKELGSVPGAGASL
ncbi:hypothetical protein LXM50_16860 [Microbacterium sp. Au-Mic1]|uniref:hypothetical protein n=1 Tax=Microbacterium sp. Au-Mic1 TaxID=2906457 RepID=UPI001E2CF349|nr:hypothetical protein [Microbacterium sp. Au-Mic1]MCE4027649.1 hypothetical protein [Microbacterium sp. Au-Mic1]